MVNQFTPKWETAFLEAEPRGANLNSVREIAGFCGW